ncbi:YceI family protein [Aquabacterium sp.]|uniref:YceI family protein n=1 Tax=Aquabacterium sp. TaxID=1872578 RepID=UPI003BAECADF
MLDQNDALINVWTQFEKICFSDCYARTPTTELLSMTSTSTGWSIDPAHTHISFSVSHLGLTHTPGIFRRFEACLDFNDSRIEASRVSFEIDVASIDTAFEMRDEHLRGPDWFNAKEHPNIVFTSAEVRHIEGIHYAIDGELTIRGVSHPVTFEVALTGQTVNPWTQSPLIGFTARATVSRSAYGMGAFASALGDAVELRLETEIVHTAPVQAQ